MEKYYILKKMPNILSALRIVLALLLLLWAYLDQPIVFVINYLVCGVSDAIDGPLARKYNATSDLGAKLDSLADFTFFCLTFVALIFVMKFTIDTNTLLCVFIAAAFKLFNFIVTKVKFKQYNIMHTIGNKFGGLCLFSSVPVFVLLNGFNIIALIVLASLMILPAIEESIILFTTKEYDVNRKSLFVKKVHTEE
ncbi:MAG: CDP-alcohol phosphatidyltransferase family protein [Clostridiales bacterium]|jgi:CDP-diacylglycerol--glycerol-3-phosphate 3-phosphatidyltransferase|nr:CDP-alcohol phosphatidyltransferase family protein [Clostridiales bacterium]